MEVSAFMTEQLKAQMAEQRAHDKDQHAELVRLLELHRHEIKAQHQENEAKLEAQREAYEAKLEAYEAKLEAQRQDYEAKLEAQRQAISSEQVAALQDRLEALHASDLLTEDQLDALEDVIVEHVEAKALAPTVSEDVAAASHRLARLVAVSEAMRTDSTFARQARKRFV